MHDLADPQTVFRFGDFTLDLARRALSLAGKPVELRPKSFDVLTVLVRASGRAVAKDELLRAVWPGLVVTDESLTRCVSDIRRALGDTDQRLVETVARFGYRFAARLSEGSGSTSLPAQQGPPFMMWRRSSFIIAVLAVLTVAAFAAAHLGTQWARPMTPRLSIVVLPLTSRNGDAQQDYIAEALTDEITVDLSRIPDSFVIAHNSAESYRGRTVDPRLVGRELGVRYVLSGHVDRLDREIRLSLQLVDTATGQALWAERFEGLLQDLPALHQRVTGTVAHSLHLRMVEFESSRAQQRPAVDADAHDLALRAWSQLRKRSPSSIASARELLLRAVSRDPQSAFAWSLLADTYTADVGFRAMHLRGATREEWLRRALEAADRAYALNANYPPALSARAYALALQGRSEPALALIQRLIALNRNDAGAWFRLSYAYTTLGRAEEAIVAGREAMRLSPRDANLSGFYVVLAAAHLHLGQDAQALDWARKSALERPDFSVAHSWVASAAANMGDLASARAALAEFRRLQPHYTVATFKAENLCAHAHCLAQRERYYDGLRKAGLPE